MGDKPWSQFLAISFPATHHQPAPTPSAGLPLFFHAHHTQSIKIATNAKLVQFLLRGFITFVINILIRH
jgi:hypothetical protein